MTDTRETASKGIATQLDFKMCFNPINFKVFLIDYLVLHLRFLPDEQYGSFCQQEMANFYILVTKGGSRWRMVFALFMKEMAAQTDAASLSSDTNTK